MASQVRMSSIVTLQTGSLLGEESAFAKWPTAGASSDFAGSIEQLGLFIYDLDVQT